MVTRSQADCTVINHDFAGFVIVTKGLGVFFLSESTKNKIINMSKERAKELNSAAWKIAKTQRSVLNRHCNVSVPGNMQIYEMASIRYDVAEAVKKLTYRVMMGYV